MKKILVFVSSLDGKTTQWDNPFVRTWSSKDDQAYFSNLWTQSRLIVVGSKTYDADPLKPATSHRIVVMTRKPSRYSAKSVEGQLEFSSETPGELVRRFEQQNEPLLLVAGGARMATSFLKAGLIDQLWLTLEPRIFGQGNGFVLTEKLDIRLRLLHVERLNDEGTLLTKYEILKPA